MLGCLNIYQMMDKDFLSHLRQTRGTIFLRDAGQDGLAIVVGIVKMPQNVDMEKFYPAEITLDVSKSYTSQSVGEESTIGNSLTGILRMQVWSKPE